MQRLSRRLRLHCTQCHGCFGFGVLSLLLQVARSRIREMACPSWRLDDRVHACVYDVLPTPNGILNCEHHCRLRVWVSRGWPIVASGCTFGALAAFIASRTILSRYVDRMVGQDHRFIALGQVLRQEGIWYLTAIRFCPLPFSLSNGFLATIPSITPLAFTLSTALSRFVHLLVILMLSVVNSYSVPNYLSTSSSEVV